MIICSPQLGLAPNSILGGEVFDREILLGLAKKGIKVEIVLPKNKPYDKNVKNWNITFLPMKHIPALLYNLLEIPYLFLIYRRRKFDIIRLHSPMYTGIGAIFFKIFHPQVKIIATYHQFRESNFGLFSKTINSFWDHIICDSKFVKNKLVKSYKLSSSKINVVHNGVPSYLKPTDKDKTLIKELGLEGKIVLLFMGLFIKRKNPLFLLEVLSELLKNRKDIILIFWGSGPLKSKIIQKAKDLKIYKHIRLINPIYGKEKNKVHNLADIFVHSSVDEGFALAPLEAMASGKPIVMTRGFSASEAVEDGVNGFLCNSNDLSYWNKRLDQLIYKPKLIYKMGQASLEKVKKESQWETSIGTHLKIFEALTKI